MNLEISMPAGYVLEVTVHGGSTGILRASSQAERVAGQVAGGVEASAEGEGAPRIKRKYTKRAKPVADELVAGGRAGDADLAMAPEDQLPAQLAGLPQKQVDFYKRKLQENLEIYDPEKARDLAIEMLRRVIGDQVS